MMKERKIIIKGTILVLIAILLLGIPIVVRADGEEGEKKELSIPFVKDYMEANFGFTFTDDQPHHIEITAPNGSVVKKDSENAEVIVSVQDVTAGTYSIVITAEEEIKVDASVECVSAIVSEHTESISVTSVISGLKIYFVDGNICVEWDDTGLGKIDVRITNPSTMQVIDSQTVSGTIYNGKLPEGIEEVEVYVVPASEARIDGAGITYTVPVVSTIDASIEVPDYDLVNTESIQVIGHFNIPVQVRVSDNGDFIYDKKFDEGDQIIEIALSGVNNDLVVYLKDVSTGNQITYSFAITRDLVAPTLSFKRAYNGERIAEDYITIQGIMKNGDYLYVNNDSVQFEEDGSFDLKIPVSPGENTIAICGEDAAGNESTSIFVIERVQKNNLNMKSLLIIIVPVLVILFLIIAVIVKKNAGKTKKKSFIEEGQTEDALVEEEIPVKEFSGNAKEEYEKLRRWHRRYDLLLGLIPFTIVIFAIIFLLISKLAIITVCQSGSMEPTIQVGEVAVFSKLGFRGSIQRGDIVLFDGAPYEEDALLLKRVIGLPGDSITFSDGEVYINGLLAKEPYLPEDMETFSSKEFQVPDGCLFVMGDNREQSIDSRLFTNPYIAVEDLRGKYVGGFYLKFMKGLKIR